MKKLAKMTTEIANTHCKKTHCLLIHVNEKCHTVVKNNTVTDICMQILIQMTLLLKQRANKDKYD